MFRASKTRPASSTFEGRSVFSVDSWSKEKQDIAAGALFVPIAQPKSELAMVLLEPRDPDSLVSLGYFAAAFERKEYMEAYVAEAVAEQMLEQAPALRREFERRLEDPKFAADPNARLDFFYERHSSWDERYNLYPVFRVASAPR